MKINKSAARAVDLLLYLSKQDHPVSLLKIEQELNIPKSSTFELVYTLVSKGFVEQIGKNFVLGMSAFFVGTGCARQMDLVQLSKPILDKLAQNCKETIFLAKFLNQELVYLDKVSQYADISSTCQIGTRKPLYSTSLGKAIMSTWSDEDIFGYYNSITPIAYTENTLVTAESMISELQLIRQQGYAHEKQESSMDFSCVAAPILDTTHRAIAAISVVAPFYRMDENTQAIWGAAVTESAKEISAKLSVYRDRL